MPVKKRNHKVRHKKRRNHAGTSLRISKLPTPHTMLVLECDSSRLRADCLSIGESLAEAGTAFSNKFQLNVKIDLIETSCYSGLTKQFLNCKENLKEVDLLVAIAHSNERTIRFVSDDYPYGSEWGLFANWVQQLKPKRLFLLACKAGNSLPVRTLFQTIPELEEVYASPEIISINKSIAVLNLVIFGLFFGNALKFKFASSAISPLLMDGPLGDLISDFLKKSDLWKELFLIANSFETGGRITRWIRSNSGDPRTTTFIEILQMLQ